MDGRRHSVDFPISRTLVALRRVRSLRDPSTNSMSKLSALVDNLNWETKSSSAIILGFDNGCSGYSNDNRVSGLESSSLFMADEQRLCEHESNYSLRNCESRLVSCESVGGFVRNTGLDAGIVKQEMVCEREESRAKCKENGDDALLINSVRSLSDCVDSGDSFTQPKTRLKKADKGCRGKSKCSSWNRKHNRLSRVRAGDVLSPEVSSCFSASDASREGLSSGMPCYRSADVDRMEPGDRGSRVRSCWSRTMKSTEPNRLSDLEEWPLLLADAGQVPLTEESIDRHQNSEGIAPCLETPRSLCQKYMPKSFEELVGQNVVAKSLLSAISNGRIASLYLFHGPRGTGKTSAARVFAAALNCLSPDIEKPCGLCRDCVLFFSGRNNDVKEVDSVEINKISRFRPLIKNVGVPPIFSRFKVYIVDECHLLRGETWAALLDKLEELPPHTVFIMVTSDLDKLPSRVVSKTQRHSFQMVKVADIASKLRVICQEEGVDIDEDALNFIATKSNGSVRDAETMLDQLSLLGKKITMSLVYEVNGVVSDAELLDLLYLAFSSDASNTIKKARELIGSRIDPLQLVSQLAGLIMNILAGKCEGASEIRTKFFGLHKSEAEMEQLRHALKILSETEKQLRMSKNQTTWLTVALLQLSSAGGASHVEDTLRLNPNILHSQDGDSLRMSADECWKHPVTSSCENVIQDEVETLELIWERATRLCESSSVKNFLQKRGKLVSVRLIQGVAVADLEFDHPDHVSRAEKSWKVIAGVLQRILGYNVELRINLASNASNKHAKLKKPSFNLFSCSRRVHLRSHFCAECGSSASEYSSYTPTAFQTRDRYVQTCSSDCGSQILHTCCHGNEMVSSIRNSDGNALSIGTKTPYKSLPDSMDRESAFAADSLSNGVTNEITNSVCFKPENRSRRREFWKLYCWRTVMFPFRKVKRRSCLEILTRDEETLYILDDELNSWQNSVELQAQALLQKKLN
ncbi:AAA-type ATPase family protein [Perilla frutescens var. hirtella]|uniref:AAA-type ATPase family protein n=1 Tax=Perilla frutescens var. hirtella TaxID=608512 RepID=A0AAD4NYW7_PERFH|nr:AAA-type ATPase family protein [Perilla frutescens var. hirtella]